METTQTPSGLLDPTRAATRQPRQPMTPAQLDALRPQNQPRPEDKLTVAQRLAQLGVPVDAAHFISRAIAALHRRIAALEAAANVHTPTGRF